MLTMHSLLAGLFALLLVACGVSEAPPTPPKSNNSIDGTGEKTHKVFVNVESSDGLALRQATVDSLTYDIACDQYEQAGLTGAAAEIYDGSTGCVLKLKSFALSNGRLYIPRATADFVDYITGEVAIFDSGDETLYVLIEMQLPATISGPSDVRYQFSELNNFDDLTAQKKVEHGVLTMLSGDFAVAIKIHAPIFDASSIQFKGECMNEAAVGPDIATGSCQGDVFSTIKLTLAPYPVTVDHATLAALSANAQNLSELGASYEPQDPGVFNGGFSVSLPFNDTDLQDRILIMNVEGSSSYLYGKIKFMAQ